MAQQPHPQRPTHPAYRPPRGRGRPFNTSTPLGQLMEARGYTVKRLEHATGIGYRKLSDYLAGRDTISAKHMALLCEEFSVDKGVLLGRKQPKAPKPKGKVRPVTPAALTRDWITRIPGIEGVEA